MGTLKRIRVILDLPLAEEGHFIDTRGHLVTTDSVLIKHPATEVEISRS